MNTQTKSSIVGFIFIKYILFFIFLMVWRGDYRILQASFMDGILYFSIFMLPLPAIIASLLVYPIYYSFRIKHTFGFICAMIALVALEYALYTFYASTSNLMNGMYNGLISVIVGLIFFGLRKRIVSKKENVSE